MAYEHYDRLTALDSVFLDIESPGVHMHVGAVGIFEPGALGTAEGGIDFDHVLAVVEAGLPRAPRLRQKLVRTPLTGRAVWVDDEHFNPLYHVRHTRLPFPGDMRLLKRLVGRVMSQKLDRGKPMWEIWFVEGLEENRFAVISKVHHCLIDGISGVDVLASFMGRDEHHRAERPSYRWMPRPAPDGARLLRDEVLRRVTTPARAVGGALAALARPRESLEDVAHTAGGFLEALGATLTPASETPLNVPIGPHRRFDWTRFDLGIVREVKRKLGGTLNDVVLACVAGAMREFLGRRGVELSGIDFRVFVPVSTRTADERGTLGNRVSMIVTPLPVGEADPRARFERVAEETSKAKRSGQAQGNEALEALSDLTATGLLAGMSRLAAGRRAYNLVVTNVPGPPFTVYLEGARMLDTFPLVPLFENQALGIALFSYDGGLYWGFNACWDALPDLHDIVLAVQHEFETLRKL